MTQLLIEALLFPDAPFSLNSTRIRTRAPQVMATRPQQQQPASHSSRTQTITADEAQPDPGSSSTPQPDQGAPVGSLRLRGRAMPGQRVQWAQETIDNEGLGRKKSKSARPRPDSRANRCQGADERLHGHARTVCCIYHKPKAFDESSDESDSSSGSGADSDGSRDSRQGGRPSSSSSARRRRHHHHHHAHSHGEGEECTGSHASGSSSAGTTRRNGSSSTMLEPAQPQDAPKPEPNAYERSGGGGGGGSSGGCGGKGKGAPGRNCSPVFGGRPRNSVQVCLLYGHAQVVPPNPLHSSVEPTHLGFSPLRMSSFVVSTIAISASSRWPAKSCFSYPLAMRRPRKPRLARETESLPFGLPPAVEGESE